MSTTYTFSPSVSGTVNRVSTTSATPIWPPDSTISVSATVGIERLFRTTNSGGSARYLSQLFEAILRFDTSSLPGPGQAFVSASISLPAAFAGLAASNMYLVADWYDPGASVDTADYIAPANGGAIGTTGSLGSSGQAVTATPQTYTIALSNLSNISRTGFTGLRLFLVHSDAVLGSSIDSANFPAMPGTNGAHTDNVDFLSFTAASIQLSVTVADPPTISLSGTLASSGGFFESATVTKLLAATLTTAGALVTGLTVIKLLDGTLATAGSIFTSIANVSPVRGVLKVLSKYDAKFSVRSKLAAVFKVRPNE